MNWIQSTNAKEIGTLYLIFSVFAFILLLISQLVYILPIILDHLTVFKNLTFYLLLHLSNNNKETGSNLPGNRGIPNSNDGNPTPAIPSSGNSEGFEVYNINRNKIQQDGTLSDTIISLIVCGTGGLLIKLSRTVSLIQIFLILGITIAVDSLGRVAQNIINDPNYIFSHYINWRAILSGRTTANVYIDNEKPKPLTVSTSVTGAESIHKLGSESSNPLVGTGCLNSGNSGSTDNLEPYKNMIVDIDIEKISEKIFKKIAEYLDYIFEPVQLSFSTEVMSNQIQNLSILL